ncbi:MAG: hypothetical protein QXM75_01415 [Candidatus Diapherotrites archaeon]
MQSKSIPSGLQSVLILFSNLLGSSLYVINETEKNPKLQDKIRIVGAVTDNLRASGIKTLEMKNICYRALDKELFLKKKGSKDDSATIEYISKLKDLTSDFKPTILLLDNFSIDGATVGNVYDIPIIETMFVALEGTKITTFSGENAVRNAILAGKRELRAGSFIYMNKRKHLLAFSKKLPLDLQKLGEIKNSDEFETYVRLYNEKYIWNCTGPLALKSIELVAEGKLEYRGEKLYIKEDGTAVQGFYNMITECVQGIEGIKNLE